MGQVTLSWDDEQTSRDALAGRDWRAAAFARSKPTSSPALFLGAGDPVAE